MDYFETVPPSVSLIRQCQRREEEKRLLSLTREFWTLQYKPVFRLVSHVSFSGLYLEWGLVILIDVAAVLRCVFVDLTPRCLQILSRKPVGVGGVGNPALYSNNHASPQRGFGRSKVCLQWVGGYNVKPRSLRSRPRDPRGHFWSLPLCTAGRRLAGVSPPLSSA